VVERLAAVARGLDEDLQLVADFFLPDVFIEMLGPQRPLDRLLVRRRRRRVDDALFGEIVGLDAHAVIVS